MHRATGTGSEHVKPLTIFSWGFWGWCTNCSTSPSTFADTLRNGDVIETDVTESDGTHTREQFDPPCGVSSPSR